jgi:hypothetical protein
MWRPLIINYNYSINKLNWFYYTDRVKIINHKYYTQLLLVYVVLQFKASGNHHNKSCISARMEEPVHIYP